MALVNPHGKEKRLESLSFTGDALKEARRRWLAHVPLGRAARPEEIAKEETGGERWSTALVDLGQIESGKWLMRQIHGVRPFTSEDPDSERIWWEDAGVHQNLTFPVQPDPVSGQHCWHQKVRVERPGPEDRYGDIFVDTRKAFDVYKEWLRLARPAPGPGGLRRPLWLPRPFKPDISTYRIT